jgi:hypothetical protein
MESKWHDNIFKVSMNQGKDPTLVFHIDFISNVRYEQHYDGAMVVNIEFYVNKITEEMESEKGSVTPKLCVRQLMLIGGNEHE